MNSRVCILVVGLGLMTACAGVSKDLSDSPRMPAAQVRKTQLECSGTEKGNTVNLLVEKTVNFDLGQVSLAFSMDATGAIDNESGSLSGKWSGLVDPKIVSAKSSIYSFIDTKNKNKIIIDDIANALNSKYLYKAQKYPGRLISVTVKTQNTQLPYLMLHGSYSSFNEKSNTMAALIYVAKTWDNPDISESQLLGQITLTCKSILTE